MRRSIEPGSRTNVVLCRDVLAQPRPDLLPQTRFGRIAEHANLELTRLARAPIDVDENLDVAAVRAAEKAPTTSTGNDCSRTASRAIRVTSDRFRSGMADNRRNHRA